MKKGNNILLKMTSENKIHEYKVQLRYEIIVVRHEIIEPIQIV